jgi:hypothetical protein
MFEAIPLISDGGFAEVTQIFGELRVVLLLLAMFLLASEGNPVKGSALVVFDYGGNDIHISGGIAQYVERVFELKGALLVRIWSHRVLLSWSLSAVYHR